MCLVISHTNDFHSCSVCEYAHVNRKDHPCKFCLFAKDETECGFKLRVKTEEL